MHNLYTRGILILLIVFLKENPIKGLFLNKQIPQYD